MIRVPSKNNLCIDDGNVWRAGGGKAILWACEANNQNQICQLR